MSLLPWQFWTILLALVIVILLLWRIAVHMAQRSTPYRTPADLENAYKEGALTWEEYDRWRQRLQPR